MAGQARPAQGVAHLGKHRTQAWALSCQCAVGRCGAKALGDSRAWMDSLGQGPGAQGGAWEVLAISPRPGPQGRGTT